MQLTPNQRYALKQLADAHAISPFEVNSVALDLHGKTRHALRDKGILGFDDKACRYVLTDQALAENAK